MIQRFLQNLIHRSWKDAKVIHHAVLPEQEVHYGSLGRPQAPPVRKALAKLGIQKLYRHQTEALERIDNGEDVVVATPTASGKSLIYNLAVTEALMENPRNRALYLFPLKALTRDQMENLDGFLQTLETDPAIRAAVYDGDTKPSERTRIRQNPPHILLSNPDMMHYGLLPYHPKWEGFWKSLRYVVVDEMHTYRGVFGSHMAQLFRRLERICRHYGSSPQFILLSATIANPVELSEQLTQRRVSLVGEHTAPQSRRHFVFFDAETSLSQLAARLLVQAVKDGLKTIVFTRSRRQTELTHMSVLRKNPRLGRRVSSYRAGFLPEERREIERKLAGGSLLGVISTSALEMGIDIGGLDVCILVGYPGTVMTTWQRGGRVGRGGRESVIILLPQPDALDQYIVRHPEEFLNSRYELAVADPDNREILKAHLPCAAAELPLEREETEAGGEPVLEALEELARSGHLMQTADGSRWLSRESRPHRNVDIRSVGPSYTIVTRDRNGKSVPLGSTDGVRAFKECHPGAVYLHRGRSYVVERLDLQNRRILATADDVPYFTRVKSEKETEILETLRSKPAGNFVVRLGRIRVTEHVTGYERRRLFTQELLDANTLELPPQTFETIGFWIEIEPVLARKIQSAKLHFMGGIHAVEHAAISMFPLFALCDRNDLAGIAYTHHPQLGKSAVFIYDGHPGGIGLAERGYDMILALLRKTKELVESCSCLEGCPACVHSPKCGAGNKPLDKLAALAVLSYLLGQWQLGDGDDGAKGEEQEVEAVSRDEESSPSCRIGFLDLETQRLAQEVGGWQNKHLMMVSVVVLYESPADRFHIYREEDLNALVQKLQSFDLIVGFNIKRFDYKVLGAYTPFDFRKLPTLDLLEVIHQQLGFRLSLDHLGERNLGKQKKGDGKKAVQWFREGRWEELVAYCREDVVITRDLFNSALEKGYLIYRDRQGQDLRARISLNLEACMGPGRRAFNASAPEAPEIKKHTPA